jgi:hypothetical protein
MGSCYAAGVFSFWPVLGLFLLVTTIIGWYFLWGPFRGGIFFGLRSEGIFLCLLACLLACRISETHRLDELDQRNLWRVKLLNNAIKDEIVWWGTLHSHHSSLISNMAGETSSRPTIAGFEISTRATLGISASYIIKYYLQVQNYEHSNGMKFCGYIGQM